MAEHMEPCLSELVLKPNSKIKRPPNAFMIFAREHRKGFARQNPNKDNKKISKLLGDTWKMTDVKTKEKYYKMAKQLELLHKQKYPGYVYCPRTARLEKSKRLARRALLRRSGDNEVEKANMEAQTSRFSDAREQKPKKEKWIQEYAKRSPTSEYVPNNPEYFTNPGEGDSFSSSILESPRSSDRSSECSPDPVYDPSVANLKGIRSKKDSISPPILKPHWDEAYPQDYMHTKRPERDSFAEFPSSNRVYCQEPISQNISSNLSHNSPNMLNYENMCQPYYIPMPEKQYFSGLSPLQIYQHQSHNALYFPRDFNCGNSGLPRFYQHPDNLNYPCCMNCIEPRKLSLPGFRYSPETSLDYPTEFRHSCPSEATRRDFAPKFRHSCPPESTRRDFAPEFRHSCPSETTRHDLPPTRYACHPETKRFDSSSEYICFPEKTILNLSPEFRHSLEKTRLDFPSEFKCSSDTKILDLPSDLEQSSEKTSFDLTHGFGRPPETKRIEFPPDFKHHTEATSLDLSEPSSETARSDMPSHFNHPPETSFDLPPRFRHPPETTILDLSSNSKHSLETTGLDVSLCCYPGLATDSAHYSEPESSHSVDTCSTNTTMNVKFEIPSEDEKQDDFIKSPELQ